MVNNPDATLSKKNEEDKPQLKITRKIGEQVVETIFLEFLGNSENQFQNLSDIPFLKEHMIQSHEYNKSNTINKIDDNKAQESRNYNSNQI